MFQVDFIAHDAIPSPVGDIADIYKPFKDAGMFLATKRTETVSTSDLIARIVKNHQLYAQRNIERGYTPHELNLHL